MLEQLKLISMATRFINQKPRLSTVQQKEYLNYFKYLSGHTKYEHLGIIAFLLHLIAVIIKFLFFDNNTYFMRKELNY